MAAKKWRYVFVVQADYGRGWEDIAESADRAQAGEAFHAHRIATPSNVYRIMQRRVRVPTD